MPRLPGQTERELEEPGLPVRILRDPIDPDAKIGADGRDLILPDAIDSRRKPLIIFGRNPRQRFIEYR